MSAPVSYYAATLALIRSRMQASGVSPEYAAVALRVAGPELEAKLSGAVLLKPSEIAALADVFGCPMSEIVA
ncbi:helix-turn-helix transcriptional regulator [Arthrobacter sp. FX8]|uniref:helix-turn-helix domain-containing protein n=1 Tax=Arthrobacter sp. FX8 TaxID=2997335 RepID=UPI00227BCB0D|nr:helix-turn-helix transcriptional regulator [Arthrobacter sp. FX8]WAJ32204.1 helix-turn-helix transcriptional regulator [Arthrobacter sp. FX8]